MKVGIATLSLASLGLVACGEPRRPAYATTDVDATRPPPAAPRDATTTSPTASPFDDGITRGARSARRKDQPASDYVAEIETSMGQLTCKLFVDKAPNTVDNFIALASGTKEWLDPRTQKWSSARAYDGTRFHRVIPGFMIQGGDPKGDGSGEPGFTIPDEIWPGAKHDRAGLLCMANRGPDTNGMQFFVTDGAAPHLDSSFTIFGECAELDVVHAIARAPRGPRDVPLAPVDILRVTIR